MTRCCLVSPQHAKDAALIAALKPLVHALDLRTMQRGPISQPTAQSTSAPPTTSRGGFDGGDRETLAEAVTIQDGNLYDPLLPPPAATRATSPALRAREGKSSAARVGLSSPASGRISPECGIVAISRLRRPLRGAKRIATEQAFQFKQGTDDVPGSRISPANCILSGLFAVAMLAHVNTAQATSFKVLHSFSTGLDGCYPSAGLIIDGAGNLYGTNGVVATPAIVARSSRFLPME